MDPRPASPLVAQLSRAPLTGALRLLHSTRGSVCALVLSAARERCATGAAAARDGTAARGYAGRRAGLARGRRTPTANTAVDVCRRRAWRGERFARGDDGAL